MRKAVVEDCVARWRSRFFDIPLLVRYILLFPDLDRRPRSNESRSCLQSTGGRRLGQDNAIRGLFNYLIKKLPEAARITKRGGERRPAGRDVTG